MIVEFIETAVLEPLREFKETQSLLETHGKDFDRHLLSAVLDQGRRESDSMLTARYYAYCYMLSHHDAMKHVLSKNRKLFQKNILDHNGNLLIVDFGCGPLIAGLALGTLTNEVAGAPLDARYAGIDDNEHVLELAKEFEACPVFGENFKATYAKDWNLADVPALVEFGQGAKGLVLVFSYFFGQSRATDKIEKLAEYCQAVLRAVQPEHATLIYLNSVHEDAGPNWIEFAKYMGIPAEDTRDNYDFRIFQGLASKPKEFSNNQLRPSLAYSVLSLDWRQYAGKPGTG